LPGIPVNGYLLLAAKSDVLAAERSTSELKLQFELESGRIIELELPFKGVHPVQQGESYPTHSMTFR
jgi:hypothetical protein